MTLMVKGTCASELRTRFCPIRFTYSLMTGSRMSLEVASTSWAYCLPMRISPSSEYQSPRPRPPTLRLPMALTSFLLPSCLTLLSSGCSTTEGAGDLEAASFESESEGAFASWPFFASGQERALGAEGAAVGWGFGVAEGLADQCSSCRPEQTLRATRTERRERPLPMLGETSSSKDSCPGPGPTLKQVYAHQEIEKPKELDAKRQARVISNDSGKHPYFPKLAAGAQDGQGCR